ITLKSVAAALPSDSALVEIISYRPFDSRAKSRHARYGQSHYVAYVLNSSGEVSFVDLGLTSALDADALKFSPMLRTPTTSVALIKRFSRKLDMRLMAPIRNMLGPIKKIFLAPDGALNLIPFGALVDADGKYLIETLSVDYLTSGRDLLRLQIKSP